MHFLKMCALVLTTVTSKSIESVEEKREKRRKLIKNDSAFGKMKSKTMFNTERVRKIHRFCLLAYYHRIRVSRHLNFEVRMNGHKMKSKQGNVLSLQFIVEWAKQHYGIMYLKDYSLYLMFEKGKLIICQFRIH